jgi:hypothetical protein
LATIHGYSLVVLIIIIKSSIDLHVAYIKVT